MKILQQAMGNMMMWSLYFHAVVIHTAKERILVQAAGQPAPVPGQGVRTVLPLSPRQLECLALFADGHDAKLVAEMMRLTRSTVQAHLLAIREKLGAKSTLDAVVKALRQGIIK